MTTKWKGHLKSEFALFQKVMDLIQFHFICADVCKIFWVWIWKDRIKVKKKKEEVFMLCSPAPWSECVKLGIVQRRLRNVQKSMMHIKSFCFVNINLLVFLPFSLLSLSKLLKLPIVVIPKFCYHGSVMPHFSFLLLKVLHDDLPGTFPIGKVNLRSYLSFKKKKLELSQGFGFVVNRLSPNCFSLGPS